MSGSTVGTRLKALRSKMGARQDEAAAACGISRIALSRYESDARIPATEIASRLAAYYSVTIDYLLNGNDAAASASEQPTELENMLLSCFRRLPDDAARQEAIRFIQFQLNRTEQPDN